MIYTKKDSVSNPDSISLKDSFFNGEDICVNCTVKVIKDGQKGDIISQYVRFCRVFDEQTKVHGRTLDAVKETIKICKDENVLKEYLERQREEVIDIMTTLFDQETVMKNHDATIRRKSRAEGEDKLGRLINALVSSHRTEDVIKASNDADAREKLYAEFRIM